jgi:cephalosporin-C deacetylase-like acetyl esterase
MSLILNIKIYCRRQIRIIPLTIFFILINFISYSELSVPLEEFYLYDKKLPFREEVREFSKSNNSITYEIFYDSVNHQRVSSLLTIPTIGKKPYPVILYLHGSGMNREIPSIGLDILASEGYAIFSLSAEFTNERKREGIPSVGVITPYPVETRNAIIQTIIDYRRGIDYLEKREEIDTKRIGIVGLSMGAFIGSILFSIDERIRCAAFAVGGGDIETLARKSILVRPALRAEENKELLLKLKKLFAPVEPLNFARNKGRPLLMVNGKKDTIVPPECGKALYEKFSEPKHIIWFEGGHVPEMDLIMKLVKNLISFLRIYLSPVSLPIIPEEKNTPPELKEINIKYGEELRQNTPIKFEAIAEDREDNICFVKLFIEADQQEVILYDDGRGVDKKANDKIFSGRCVLNYDAKVGKSKIIAFAVDYNGEISNKKEIFINVLPIKYPEGTNPPAIEKVEIPKKVKFGEKIYIKVEVSDKENDVVEVLAEIVELGLSESLKKGKDKENIYEYEMKIPKEAEEFVQAGKYHISVIAKDKTYRMSEKKIFPIILEK